MRAIESARGAQELRIVLVLRRQLDPHLLRLPFAGHAAVAHREPDAAPDQESDDDEQKTDGNAQSDEVYHWDGRAGGRNIFFRNHDFRQVGLQQHIDCGAEPDHDSQQARGPHKTEAPFGWSLARRRREADPAPVRRKVRAQHAAQRLNLVGAPAQDRREPAGERLRRLRRRAALFQELQQPQHFELLAESGGQLGALEIGD